jgi:hypothetical protein
MVDGNQADNSASESGAGYVFVRSGNSWTQQAYIKASNASAYDHFGTVVSLSGDGNRLAVSAVDEDSFATNVGGDQGDDPTYTDQGAVYLFDRSGSSWSQQAYVKASFQDTYGGFGQAVQLSGDGNTLAIGRDTFAAKGGVDVFTYSGALWSHQFFITPAIVETVDYFGTSVAISDNGNMLVVGAVGEDGQGVELSGNPYSNFYSNSGAAYLFTRSGSSWSQKSYIKATNTGTDDRFGQSIAITGDGNSLAVGAIGESSIAKGVNGDQSDNSAANAGAVYLY